MYISFIHRHIGSRYLEVAALTREEAWRMMGQEGDRKRVLAYRRLLALAGRNTEDTMVQLDDIDLDVPREAIFQAAGTGATLIIATTVQNDRLRVLVVYNTPQDANAALEEARSRRVMGMPYTARPLGLEYSTMIANRTDTPTRSGRFRLGEDRWHRVRSSSTESGRSGSSRGNQGAAAPAKKQEVPGGGSGMEQTPAAPGAGMKLPPPEKPKPAPPPAAPGAGMKLPPPAEKPKPASAKAAAAPAAPVGPPLSNPAPAAPASSAQEILTVTLEDEGGEAAAHSPPEPATQKSKVVEIVTLDGSEEGDETSGGNKTINLDFGSHEDETATPDGNNKKGAAAAAASATPDGNNNKKGAATAAASATPDGNNNKKGAAAAAASATPDGNNKKDTDAGMKPAGTFQPRAAAGPRPGWCMVS